jgi:hypothetical protein
MNAGYHPHFPPRIHAEFCELRSQGNRENGERAYHDVVLVDDASDLGLKRVGRERVGRRVKAGGFGLGLLLSESRTPAFPPLFPSLIA